MAVTVQRRLNVDHVLEFGRHNTTCEASDLTIMQTKSYERFLQADVPAEERENIGLEATLRESFPIYDSYDKTTRLEYVSYVLEKPRYLPDECRRLKITYGRPWRVRFRLVSDKGTVEEDVYLGELPIMLGGGEFIINGAERVVVNQLHRSPGVDFLRVTEHDAQSFSCRVIPERGSWVECNISRKESIVVRIDQSNKLPIMTLLRAMDEKYSTDVQLFGAFYDVKEVKVKGPKSIPELEGKIAVGKIVDPEDPESVLCGSGEVIRTEVAESICELTSSDPNKKGKPRFSTIYVIDKPRNMLLVNSLAEDPTDSHDYAQLYIFKRLRPGNPQNVLDKARELFKEKFTDPARYRIGRVGRFRMNRKLETNVDLDETALRADDLVVAIKYLNHLWEGTPGYAPDDIDHLGNRRIRTIDELLSDDLRSKGFLKLRRNIADRLRDGTSPRKIINQKNISSAIEFFFGRNELSQVVDQTNPLSMLTHERRLSALGPGGLNRKRAGFEVRDVHATHYGRICPIETPEGQNIGLISYLSLYARIDEYGFLVAPYRKVVKGVVMDEIVWLRADDELDKKLAPADTPRRACPESPFGALEPNPATGLVLARMNGEYTQIKPKEVDFVDVAPTQMISVSASLIPFLEHDDANRALMGSNMQRQAVPLLQSEAPIVGTGLEPVAALNSSLLVRAKKSGTVTYMDAKKIVIDDRDVYILRKFAGLNGSSCENQRPIVKIGQHVNQGDVIADGACTDHGVLALGRNVLVGFMIWDGYNYEDAVILSEELVQKDVYTSIHIEEYEAEIRETKLGREEFTRDVPNVSDKTIANLDENGVVRVGTFVSHGDVLVGKTAPKNKTELTPEERLLHAIFGRSGEEVKNESLTVPAGVEGVVIGAYHFRSRASLSEDERRQYDKDLAQVEHDGNAKIAKAFGGMIAEMEGVVGDLFQMKGFDGQPLVQARPTADVAEAAKTYSFVSMCEHNDIEKGSSVYDECLKIFHERRQAYEDAIDERDRKINEMKSGEQLKRGVLQMVKVYIATKRVISVGDKMAGRHGNKGVIAKILPREDMPFLADGTPLQIMLNPMGVPSRMNVGQILETHLGWAASKLGYRAITPVFDGATEEDVNNELEKAGLPRNGKVQLYDGRTGEPFAQETTVGYIYMLKLHHLVDEKIHARSTGPYSLITQQPLGGKARSGGQRYGEMEVWALEAYGAAYMLQELMTVKSDDIEGRTKMYENIVKGENTLKAGTPASFEVLVNELRGLGLDVDYIYPEILGNLDGRGLD